jgi:hypothetical protein
MEKEQRISSLQKNLHEAKTSSLGIAKSWGFA